MTTLSNILIVGESLNKSNETGEPFNCKSGERLARLLGLKFPHEFLELTDRVNLFEDYIPDYRWNLDLACLAAEQIDFLARGRLVLLCGARVRQAFNLGHYPFLSVMTRNATTNDCQILQTTFLLIPHPSGLNRMWNDPALEAEVQDFLSKQLLGLYDQSSRRIKELEEVEDAT